MAALGARRIQIFTQLFSGKATRALLPLAFALAILAAAPQLTHAQFIPCKVVNLNVVPPAVVQAGQPFQVTTNLTVSCDPSILPILRVDLLDATSSAVISTDSVPYYPSASSFLASVVNQATARPLTGSWSLQVQVYVISSLNGRSVASTAQLFQVNVEPYTPPATETQTTEVTTQTSTSSTASTTQLAPAATELENTAETTISSELPVTNEATSGPAGEFLVPAAIILVGLALFGLMFATSRRKPRPASGVNCAQCGAELIHDAKYCTKCGAKQA